MTTKNPFPPIRWLWQDYERAAAWYSGEPARLRRHCASRDSFWGSDEKIKLHVPMAADLAALSAGMIFSASPEVKTENEAAQTRIDEIFNLAGVYNVLLQAAELASAYGGVFIKWSWDKADGFPRLTAVPADSGLPEWENGRISRIILWSPVRTDEATGAIWRIQEAYTPDGHIRTTLHKGDLSNLGDAYPLTAIDETRSIRPDANSGTDTMLAFYVPNILPNRSMPHTRFGRSDFDGLYGLFDALDEAYSAIQRETRMTKTTVIVPAEYLRRRDAIFSAEGMKATEFVFCNNTGAFTALDIDSDRSSSPITVVNPEIRAESRTAVCDDLIRRILSMAGYAPQSAGLDVSGSAESGTALSVRERKSIRTTETKKTYWWHAVNDIVRSMLRLDAAVFRSGVNPEEEFSVELPANNQPDIGQLAEIVEQLERAGAVSVETKVDMLHPDWTDEQKDEEIQRILEQKGMIGPDPIDPGLGDLEGGGSE